MSEATSLGRELARGVYLAAELPTTEERGSAYLDLLLLVNFLRPLLVDADYDLIERALEDTKGDDGDVGTGRPGAVAE
jgi:hypothetical protein